jgi:phosphate:Na+ symporter
VAVLVAALIAWAAHSSIATVLLIMSLASSGVVPIYTALALVLGANLGSGITAFMLSSGMPPEGRRVALGNLCFRATGVVVGLLVLRFVPPEAASLGPHEARQIANFHTLFNLLLALAALPLVGLAARLLERMLRPLPTLEQTLAGNGQARLDAASLERPGEALAQATRELVRIADVVETMLREAMPLFANRDEDRARLLQRLDDRVDHNTSAVKLYLALLTRGELSPGEALRCQALTDFAIKLEQLGDIVDNSLLDLARKVRKQGLKFSSEGWRELSELHSRVLQNFDLALHVLLTEDLEAARQLVAEQDRIRARERASRDRHLGRLRSGDPESIASSTVHLDVLRDLKEVNRTLTSVAYPLLERAGQLAASRLREPRPDGPEQSSQ